MHWAQHKRHNRKFNLKLIYWWSVIRIPTKTNKSTWQWEKYQLVRMEATNIAIRSQGKSYTNWSTSEKPGSNVPSAILDSKIKSFEVKMLMGANICSFHKKQTLDFWPWNTGLHASVSLHSAKTPSVFARSKEKRSYIFGVGWLKFTNARFISFSLLRQRRQKMDS